MSNILILPGLMDALSVDVEGETWKFTDSGLLLPPPRPKRKPARPIGIDLFCGCGGFSLGVIQAGFDVVSAIDSDPTAAITYLVNLGAYPIDLRFTSDHYRELFAREMARDYKRAGWTINDAGEVLDYNPKRDKSGRKAGELPIPLTSGYNRHRVCPSEYEGVKVFWFGDVRELTGQMMLDALGLEQGDVDFVFGGPPCQGFSTSGQRNVMDPRNSLIFEFARLVLDIQPKAIAMENVPGIMSMITPDGLPVVESFCQILEDGGFGTYDMIRKMLGVTSGVGYIRRSKPKAKREKKSADPVEPFDPEHDPDAEAVERTVQRQLMPLEGA